MNEYALFTFSMVTGTYQSLDLSLFHHVILTLFFLVKLTDIFFKACGVADLTKIYGLGKVLKFLIMGKVGLLPLDQKENTYL
jgi:hypothetical protein